MANNNTTPTKKVSKPETSACRAESPISQFSRFINERFTLTPESMGLDRRSDIRRPYQQQHSTPRAEISYERHYIKQQGVPKQECTMPPQMSSNYSGDPISAHDNQTNMQNSLSYNQSFPAEQSLPSNLLSSMNLENLQQPCSTFKILPKCPTQQMGCENSLSTEETAQHQNSCCNNTNNLCPSAQQPAQSKFLSCGNLPNRTRSEQPMSISSALSRCNISCMPSASSTLQCLKSPGLQTCESTAPITGDNHHCDHPSHSSAQNVWALSEIPTAHYEQLLQKYRSGNSAKSFGALNDIFLMRLQDIDANAQGDSDLKLITYQEWVDMLLNANDTITRIMEELESEVAERLQMLQRKITTNCRHSQGNELMKCRKDIDTLIKFIQNAYQYNNWDLQCIAFETITSDQILGSEELQCETVNAPLRTTNEAGGSMHTNKLLANISALAFEVAEKHDEVLQLKQQVISMEDEIQKAHQKIQLKDDVIKELRNDLKCGNNKLPHRGSVEEACLDMPPINLENQSSRSVNTQLSECNQLLSPDDTGSQFESLSHNEQEEELKLKVLDEELKDLLTISRETNINTKQKMQEQSQHLHDIFKRIENEKAAAYHKLDFIRRQLIDLESSNSEGANDCDSGFHSKSENDQDAKILDSVRRRLRKLKETIFELKMHVQKLELENNELSTSLNSEKSFSQHNSETIKQVADLLCEMRGKQISCTDIYNNTQARMNPFCEVIMEMQNEFKEREFQCLQLVRMKNKRIDELTLALINKEKMFGDKQNTRLNIIDLENLNTTTTLPPTTTPPAPIPCTSLPATASTSTATFLTGQTSLQDVKET